MIFIAVTRMKNEIDIAEAFVRHHAKLFTRLIVIDDFSSDGTFDLLLALRDEGLPIELHRETEIGTAQSETITRWMRVAFDEMGADWVVPIDADEFFECRGGDVASHLPSDCRYAVEMRWDNFVWTGDDPSDPEWNPVIRLKQRMPTRRWHYKVMIPRFIGGRPEARVAEGSHAVLLGDRPCDTLFVDAIHLCHFPIRSVDQFTYKSVIGYLRYFQDSDPNAGFHYREPIRLLRTDMAQFTARMSDMSRHYSLSDEERNEGQPSIDPLDYLGGPLRHPRAAVSVVPVLSNLLEDLFRQLTARNRENDTLKALVAGQGSAIDDSGVETSQSMLRHATAEAVSLRQRLQIALDTLSTVRQQRQSLRFLASEIRDLAWTKGLERLSNRVHKANPRG